ncbi:MAG: carbamoyltransferase [Thermoleophilaceae bacterium]|nr:carbamoyltransferase [Thermoleophilaceae bacterium]
MLGFGGSDHDFSAALARGTDIKVAIERERLMGVKYGSPHWFEEPFEVCADYCLDAAGITREQVDRIVTHDLLPNRSKRAWPMTTFGHHICHAASAVMLLDEAASACVLVYDGCGSVLPLDQDGGLPRARHEAFSFFHFADERLEWLGTTYGERFIDVVEAGDGGTNSMGDLYSLVTEALGFDRLEAGKTMGLAAWGSPRFVDEFLDHVQFGADVSSAFRCDPFDAQFQERLFGHLRDEAHSFAVRADLAASMQEILNMGLLHCYELIANREFDVFCIAGGCGLNTVANGVLAAHLPEGRALVVPPYAGDSGLGLGALWLDLRERLPGSFRMTLRGGALMPAIARPGRTYDASEGLRAASAKIADLAENPAIDRPEALARVLAEGAAIGVFNGASEIGPRALGGRSVLADPRNPAMRERINRHIKQREPFRPLAPMVLEEHFDRYFAPSAAADPFMLVVAKANDRCVREAPAIVHVDGTARVQVVGAGGDPFLVRLLREFHLLTGVPILLNTSFNRRGKPIVESPQDAVEAFLAMGLDGLYLDGRFLYRPATGEPRGCGALQALRRLGVAD